MAGGFSTQHGDAPQDAVSTQGNAANPPTSNTGGDPVASSGSALPYESRNHEESIQDTMNERAAAAPQAKPFDAGKVRNTSPFTAGAGRPILELMAAVLTELNVEWVDSRLWSCGIIMHVSTLVRIVITPACTKTMRHACADAWYTSGRLRVTASLARRWTSSTLLRNQRDLGRTA